MVTCSEFSERPPRMPVRGHITNTAFCYARGFVCQRLKNSVKSKGIGTLLLKKVAVIFFWPFCNSFALIEYLSLEIMLLQKKAT